LLIHTRSEKWCDGKGVYPAGSIAHQERGLGWAGFWAAVTAPRVLASYQLTFGASLIAALVNLAFGALVA